METTSPVLEWTSEGRGRSLEDRDLVTQVSGITGTMIQEARELIGAAAEVGEVVKIIILGLTKYKTVKLLKY